MKENQNLPKATLSATINIGNATADCYHLDNGMRVISGNGIQRALGMSQKEFGGNSLKLMLLSRKNKDCLPEKFILLENAFNQEFVKFIPKSASSALPFANGYEATFLIDICHYIQDLKVAGLLAEKYDFLYINATIIARAYSKLGLIAHIDEATGHIKNLKAQEYQKLFDTFVLEEFGEWQLMFDREFFDVIWKCWLQQPQPKHNKRAGFFGKIIRKYIYRVLAIKELGYTEEALGVLLKKLDIKNPDRKVCHHQFLTDVGHEALKQHIIKFKTIGAMSNNRRQFDNNFEKVFKISQQGILFESDD